MHCKNSMGFILESSFQPLMGGATIYSSIKRILLSKIFPSKVAYVNIQFRVCVLICLVCGIQWRSVFMNLIFYGSSSLFSYYLRNPLFLHFQWFRFELIKTDPNRIIINHIVGASKALPHRASKSNCF